MSLLVLPSPDTYTLIPYRSAQENSPANYIGRKFDPATKTYPETGKPFESDPSTREGRRIKKLVRRGELIPANKETADLCGVQFSASSNN